MGIWDGVMDYEALTGMHIQVGFFFIISPYVGGVASVIVFRMGCPMGFPHPFCWFTLGILSIYIYRVYRILMDIGYVGYVGSIDVYWVIYILNRTIVDRGIPNFTLIVAGDLFSQRTEPP